MKIKLTTNGEEESLREVFKNVFKQLTKFDELQFIWTSPKTL